MRWRARKLYREGAPPRQREASGRTEVEGRFQISSDGTVVLIRPTTASNVSPPAAEPRFEAPMQTAVGDRNYALESAVRHPGEVSVMLNARDRNSGAVVWESEIKRQPQSRPPPRRM